MDDRRHYGLDLLRIAAMALIVLRHGVYQSGVTSAPDATKLNYFLGVFVNDFTAIAVNCFVILSGYFLSRQEFRARRLVSLWATVLFYSLAVYAGSLFTAAPGAAPGLLAAFTPISSYTYWFISLYFLVTLVSPLLNAAAGALERPAGRLAYGAAVVFLSLLPTFGIDLAGAEKGYSFVWFAFLYLTGAFLRLSPRPSNPERARPLLINGLGYLAMLGFSLAYLVAKKALKAKGIELTAPDDYNFLPTFLASVFAFRFFAALEIGSSALRRAIAFLAPLVLGVYLIHDHYLKHALWHDLLGIDRFRASSAWLYQVPLRIAAVFAAGCAVEWTRRTLFGLFRRKTA